MSCQSTNSSSLSRMRAFSHDFFTSNESRRCIIRFTKSISGFVDLIVLDRWRREVYGSVFSSALPLEVHDSTIEAVFDRFKLLVVSLPVMDVAGVLFSVYASQLKCDCC